MEQKIIELRKQNLTYSSIANQLGLTIDKVKYICKKNNIKKSKKEYPCKICGENTGGNRIYCSDECRTELSENDIKIIKKLRAESYTIKEIAYKFNSTPKKI